MAKLPHLNLMHSHPLPSPQDLLEALPLSLPQQYFVEKTRKEIKGILDGHDPRFLLIVGPCSIHDIIAAKEYASKLQTLAQEVSETLLLVMRVYFEKPRTALGWKGFLYDPWLDGSNDLPAGIRMTRQLLLDLATMQVPAAAEFLDPVSAYYFGDLISWGCIGARTASSQTHRQLASALQMPIGFKNSTDGNVDVAVNGVLNAASSHSFIGLNADGVLSTLHSKGNSHGHIVLRGGERLTNYDPASVSQALERLKKAKLPPRLLVDCSHDNALRDHERQASVFQTVLNQVIEGNGEIRGALLESHLNGGNQPFVADNSPLQYAVSLTDPCLSWLETKNLILWAHSQLSREKPVQEEPQYAHALTPYSV